jgi:hypothetical protein
MYPDKLQKKGSSWQGSSFTKGMLIIYFQLLVLSLLVAIVFFLDL